MGDPKGGGNGDPADVEATQEKLDKILERAHDPEDKDYEGEGK